MAYAKKLINYLIILIQVDRQSESAILWIIKHSGQAPRGREPQHGSQAFRVDRDYLCSIRYAKMS